MKLRKLAERKRELVRDLLMKGTSQADAIRAVRKKYRRGIAARDVIKLAKEVKDFKEVLHPEVRSTVKPLPPGKYNVKYQMEGQKPVLTVIDKEVNRNHQEFMAKLASARVEPHMRRFKTKAGAEGVQFADGAVVLNASAIEWLDP